MCDSSVQTNNVASYFVQSVSDPFIVRHLYCNICCTDAMFIREVLTHFTDRNGDMEGKSACLSGCKSSGRAGNRKKRVGQVPRENSGLFLLYIWLVSPAPKILLTVGLNTLKSTLPYIAQIKSTLPYSAQIKGKEHHCARTACSFKVVSKIDFHVQG